MLVAINDLFIGGVHHITGGAGLETFRIINPSSPRVSSFQSGHQSLSHIPRATVVASGYSTIRNWPLLRQCAGICGCFFEIYMLCQAEQELSPSMGVLFH